MEEETGYVAEKMVQLATLYDNPVKDTNKMYLLFAENAHPSGTQQLDVTEAVEVVLVPVKEVMTRISTGEICVCGTIAALFLGLNLLSQRSITQIAPG